MKRRIIVSEKGFKTLLEARNMLNENLGRQMQKARKILRSHGYSDEDAKAKVEEWETKPCFKQNDGFGLSGYARMETQNQFKSFSEDDKARFFNILNMIAKKYSDIISPDLKVRTTSKEFTAESLYDSYLDEYLDYIRNQKKNDAIQRTRNKRYAIYRIPNFETAEEWSNAVPWCITKTKEDYARECNDGNGIFVFCVRDDYRGRFHDESGAPYDDYGLSMIAVCIDKDGEIYSCTSRYNHRKGNDGQLFNKEQLEELLGVDFNKYFYPRTDDEPFVDNRKDYYTWLQELKNDAVELGNNLYLAQRYDNEEYELSTDTLAEYYLSCWVEGEEPFIVSGIPFYRNTEYKWFGDCLVIKTRDDDYMLFGYENARYSNYMYEEYYHNFTEFECQHNCLICRDAYDAEDIFAININTLKNIEIDNCTNYKFLTFPTQSGKCLYIEFWPDRFETLKTLYLVSDNFIKIADDEEPYNSPNGDLYVKEYPKYGYVIPISSDTSSDYVRYINPINGRTVYDNVPLEQVFKEHETKQSLKRMVVEELKKLRMI